MRRILLVLILCCFCPSAKMFAWNSQGHKLIVKIAKSQLDKEVIEWVDYYLRGMSWEIASSWMDMVKNDPRYSSMKAWHYVYVDKDKTYVKTKEPNIVNQLEFCIILLKNRNLLEMEKVGELLRVLFHLMGDIHQPLNCGYLADKGGSDTLVKFLEKQSTLYKVWDSDILEEQKTDLWACSKILLNLGKRERAEMEKIDVQAWMKDSRLLLPAAYNVKNGKVEKDYIETNSPLICRQLVKGGLRLASILNLLFKGKTY